MSDIKQTMQAWWISNNLSFLTRYWHTAKAAMVRVADAPETFEEFRLHGGDRAYVDAVLSNHLDHHNSAAVLLVFANFEEFFSALCVDLATVHGVATETSDLKDRGVQRFKKFIHKVCQVSEEELEINWAFLRDLSVVRNCLVHANGNRSQFSDKKTLDRVLEAYPNELSYAHKVKLRISDEFVVRCIRETERASLSLVDHLTAQPNEAMPPTDKVGG